MSEYKAKPTGAKRTIDGVVFYSWQVGIMRYEWRTENQRIHVWPHSDRHSTYCASVDNYRLLPRFRSQENAARAALKALRQKSDD